MKKLLPITIWLLLYSLVAQSQYSQIIGTTNNGAANDAGAIFRINGTGTDPKTLYNIPVAVSGYANYPMLLKSSTGLIYGTLREGIAPLRGGCVFTFDTTDNSFSILRTFTAVDTGAHDPMAGLVEANNGKLYAVSRDGGWNQGGGVLYTVDTATKYVYTVADPLNAVVNNAQSELIQASNGKLYGMTSYGGVAHAYGNIIEYDIANNILRTVYEFDDAGNGSYPYASFTDVNGLLYSYTTGGGLYDNGIIFSFNPATLALTKLVDVDTTFGGIRMEKLTYNGHGKLYGVVQASISQPNGSLFAFDMASNILSTALVFDSTGYRPHSSLLKASDGRFYGTTELGGINQAGSVYSVDSTLHDYKLIYSFSYTNDSLGFKPYGELMEINLIDTACHALFHIFPDSLNAGVYFGYDSSTGNNLSYLWEFGDGDTSTEHYPSHTYATAGTYNVCLTINANIKCTDTYCDSSYIVFKTEGGLMHQLNIIDPNAPVGISEVKNANTISIIPNPATDRIFIDIKGSTLKQLNIYSIDGKLVKHFDKADSNYFDVKELNSGMYIAEIVLTTKTERLRWIKK